MSRATHRAGLLCTVFALAVGAGAAEVQVAEGTNLSIDVSPTDRRIAFDLLGGVWLLPPHGGVAERLPTPGLLAQRPRWSPDGSSILFQAEYDGAATLWRVDADDGAPVRLTARGASEQHAAWHPSGERIVFAAARDGSGLDLWERDLATGLGWRVTSGPGDESAPAWSANGRHLAWIGHEDGAWRLMLRRFGHPPRVLVESGRPLHAPAWRPDNTLLTYLREEPDGSLGLYLLILSDPPLERPIASGEDFFAAPVSWVDRTRYVYAADGVIRSRPFEPGRVRELPFTAAIDRGESPGTLGDRERPLPDEPAADGTLVLRAARLYDGESGAYRERVDVLIESGRIAAIEAIEDRPGAIVVDLPGTTVMPGLIDAWSALPDPDRRSLTLAFGVTTLVSPDASAGEPAADGSLPAPRLLAAADGTAAPGRRPVANVRLVRAPNGAAADLSAWRRLGVPVLADNWVSGLTGGADLLLGTALLPASPAGRRYADVSGLMRGGPLTLVSGLADAGTPGLAALRESPPGRLLEAGRDVARRYVGAPAVGDGGIEVIVGSRPSGLPAGLATQAELLALSAAGLEAHAVLHAATGAAADALGLAGELGRIRPGLRADLLIVAGDPLARIGDAGHVVGLVVDGRFLSVAGLLDASDARRAVE